MGMSKRSMPSEQMVKNDVVSSGACIEVERIGYGENI